MKSKNSSLLFILITICLDSIGIGIIIPSFPTLVAETTNLSVEASKAYYGPILASYALMQFLFSPLIGNLSDRFGRRPILLISVCGMGIDYLFMFFAPNLWWLFLGRMIAGMFGASFTSAAAYIADISTDEDRAKNFGFIGAAFGLGFIIGPAIGGLLTDFGSRAPFLAAAILSLANFAFGFFVLKESLSENQRRKFDWKRANPLGAVKQMARFKKMKYLFFVTFLVMIANMGVHAVWNYYAMEKFAWTEKEIGYSLAVVGICFGVIQGGLSGWLVKTLKERGAATLGIATLALTCIFFGIISKGWMMYALILPYALAGIIDPAIRSLISGQTAANEQGELQGVFTSLMSLSEIISPIISTSIYAQAVFFTFLGDYRSGISYFMNACFAILALLLLRWTLKTTSQNHVSKEGEIKDNPSLAVVNSENQPETL